jgi:SAM-dependent methyltransferase
MSEPISQEEYFLTTGGDAYFFRNAQGQDQPRRDLLAWELIRELPARTLPEQGHAAVLGGAGGREAAGLSELLPGWRLTNVDISAKAIEFGRTTFPEIEHQCLSISGKDPHLATAIGKQDLIFVVGVLLWLDRQHLARAIANIDESLRDGGHLLIYDFLPSRARKIPIRHSPAHHTFKQDYSEPFLSLGTYELVSMKSYVGAEPAEIPADERRHGIHLLRKDLEGLYPLGWTG